MLGAIAGDVIGSVYEWNNIKSRDFTLLSEDGFFTDDTILTVALAEAILTGASYGPLMRDYYKRYPCATYGGRFHLWARSEDQRPYGSWGNGAAMRISPVAYAFQTLDEVLRQAAHFTAVTHDHPEGIKGAQATAAAIFIGRSGGTKAEIRDYVTRSMGYDLSPTVASIRPNFQFDESCQGTVPAALICFLESDGFEDTVRNAISLGGDSDTLACIAGAVAEGFYGAVPGEIAAHVLAKLDDHLRDVTARFVERHCRR